MTELDIKHWSAYYPYEVEVIVDDEEEPCLVVAINIQSIFIDSGCDYAFSDAKMILHPLSDIHKEIEHKGKKFIPYEYISGYARDIIDEINKEIVRYKKSKAKINIDINILTRNHLQMMPNRDFILLLSYHFDMFNLIPDKLAININTL